RSKTTKHIGNVDEILTIKYIGTDYSYHHQIVWKNVVGFILLHAFALWGLVLIFTGIALWKTSVWGLCILYIGSEGVTIGAHRCYAHRSFKATPLLRAVMVITQTLAGQNSVYTWCRDHRLHHRYSDTDADPHNSKRGFFFCHIGWLMHKKHPYVKKFGNIIDLSDLQNDWMVMFQKKYYKILYPVLAILFPVWVPVRYFGETWWNSLLVSYFARYVCQLHGTWCVNSVAHLYGTRPYDKNLQAVESWFVSFLSLGEGWHNYHHAFPWDYKAAELTMHFNLSASIIRFFERIGLAYHLKSASADMIASRIKRTGDGTHHKMGTEEERTAVTAAPSSNDLKDLIKDENGNKEETMEIPKVIGTDYSYKHTIVWKNAIGFLVMHILALWGVGLLFAGYMTWKTIVWIFFITFLASEGITIGAHRFYTHKSFKATPFLKAVFILCQTIAGQNSMFIWCRDHRLHHRYSDTDGDPHNSKRGFFFCHIGWLMHKKHPYVVQLGRKIDMSDLQADWMVMLQKKYYYQLYFFLAFLIPVWVPVHFFGESVLNSILVCYFARYMLQLNGTWLVNSAAHLYGTRPYDAKLQPVESWFVSMISLGEGWHNYHHTFPWDYKAAELTMHFNQSASIIRFFERIGLAYDLKTASPELVTNRILRTGDGSHFKMGNEEARAAVTAWGPLHPLNPTYNTTLKAPDAILKPEGLPLYHEKDTLNLTVIQKNSRRG
ncbi:hypothetical protein HW555_010420, partial [Spodoptera exigua]